MAQNKRMKKHNEYLEEKVHEKVSFYEKELLNLRNEHEKKSSKVIENFHKCISLKQDFEK